MRVARVLRWSIVATVSVAGQARSQLPPVRPLAPPTARLEEEFSTITSVRELADGRVLVTDPRDDRLVVVDFVTGEVVQVGRKGRGPGEYMFVSPLRQLAGDSTLMAGLSDRRWLLLHGVRIVATLPPDAPLVGMGTPVFGADSLGRILGQRSPRAPAGVSVTDHRDSSWLILGDRRTGKLDTIARIRQSERQIELQYDSAGRVSGSSASGSPLAVPEEGLLFLDGWVAIARREPYRVEWRRPDGGWIRGPLLPFERIRLTRAEKEAVMRFRAARFGYARVSDPDQFTRWPEYYPPYSWESIARLVPTPEGRVMVRRTRTATSKVIVHDIIDRTGRLVDRVSIALDQEILALGRRTAYVVTTDEDGLRRLSRHPWP